VSISEPLDGFYANVHPLDELEDLIVTGAVPSEQLASHLVTCAVCREHAQDVEFAFHLMAHVAPVHVPPATVKDELLRRVEDLASRQGAPVWK
jgi:hypothetical protein